MTFSVGDAVRINRDETLFPSKGTWKNFAGKAGFVVMVSDGAGPFDTNEFGVVVTTTRPPWRKDAGHTNEVNYDSEAVRWFLEHELTSRNG